MNLPTTYEAVVILALLLLPGYIFGQVAGRAIAHSSDAIDVRYIFRIFATGIALHACLFPYWTVDLVRLYNADLLSTAIDRTFWWFVTTSFLWPVVAGTLVGLLIPTKGVDWMLDKICRGYIDRLPSAWDYAVRLGPAWVKVYLHDGSIIGGLYADQSVASIDSRHRDLYIEQVYTLDDTGVINDAVTDSLGMWISAAAIDRIEFLYGGIADGNGGDLDGTDSMDHQFDAPAASDT